MTSDLHRTQEVLVGRLDHPDDAGDLQAVDRPARNEIGDREAAPGAVSTATIPRLCAGTGRVADLSVDLELHVLEAFASQFHVTAGAVDAGVRQGAVDAGVRWGGGG